jgi:uncharacterized protein
MKRNGFFLKLRLIILFSIFPLASGNLHAGQIPDPVISIIIDDIGYRNIHDINALKLPGPITYAIMPHAPLSIKFSEMAGKSGKNIILHLPMEAIEYDMNRYLGPGALKLEMSEKQFISTLSRNIDSIPNIIGVNNHMGSLLTMQTVQMEWLMDYLHIHKIFYVDSLTNQNSVAALMAMKKKVPYLKRDVFLDNTRDKKYIYAQFKELINIAIRKGKAIAIGHPYPETIEVLFENLPGLVEYGVRLISLDEMVSLHQNQTAKLVSPY